MLHFGPLRNCIINFRIQLDKRLKICIRINDTTDLSGHINAKERRQPKCGCTLLVTHNIKVSPQDVPQSKGFL